jgi:hypothetical protein
MAWNKNIHIGGIFCELTKAFDYVNHDVITANLEHYGIQESTLNWYNLTYQIGDKEQNQVFIKTKFIILHGKL